MKALKCRPSPEEQHLKDLEYIEKLRPIDDDFMREMFRNNIPLAQLVLRIITGKEDLVIISQETQYDMKLVGSRSVCLDVLATDSEGRRYNLEIQRSDKGAAPKRARYHSSAMDIDYMSPGDDFEKLPISYVIFITENDIRGENRPIYTFERIDTVSGKSFGDEEYIILVNGAYSNKADNTLLADLIHDFGCSSADNMHLELMCESARYYKESKKGVVQMCKLLEEMRNEYAELVAAEVAAETTIKNSEENAVNFLKLGKNTISDISLCTGVSVERIVQLAEENNIPIPADTI